MYDDDTIVAIATAPGRGAVGVVRLSGPAVPRLTEALLGRLPAPRTATLGGIHAADGTVIDQGLALYFPGPASYTGQTVFEFQGHGGPVVLNLVLQRCLELGVRLAEPGEFTRRAYLNRKLDLAQAEAVADLIDASTAAAARSAQRSLSGAFSERIHDLQEALTELRVLVEGSLDFPEEEIDFLAEGNARGRLERVLATLGDVLAACRQGSLLREGARIVLVGQPNVGKSSLLNRLAGDELAIVTDIPGTTRDVIRQAIDLDGLPAFIIDTAGLRASDDPVEQAGMDRTWRAAERAELVLLLVDAGRGVAAADAAIAERLPAGLPRVIVHNKIDLHGLPARVEEAAGGTHVWLSAKSDLGITELRAVLRRALGWGGTEEGVFHARARHIAALERAERHIQAAVAASGQLELHAEELRLAQAALSLITGEFTADDLLGEIFSRFCIGK